MDSRIKVLNHPLHPFLVHLPVGLFVTSLIFDIVAIAAAMPILAGASFWMMVFGVGFALLAAIPGFVDYLLLDLTRGARRLATYHMILNLTVVALFIADILWRVSLFRRIPTIIYLVPTGPFILSIVGVLTLAVSGWIGGQLVYRHHVGVTAAGETVREEVRAPFR
jgi:uncharacterized membrane protein